MGMYNYGYEAVPEYGQIAAAGIAGFLGVFLVLYYLLIIGFGIVTYIFQSVSLYSIAKRRGIHHSWLAWIPVGEAWLLGSVSDQYQYVAKGRIRNRRRVLLGLNIAMFVLLFVIVAALVAIAVGETAVMEAGGVLIGSSFAIMLLGYLAMLVIAIVLAVFRYVALYDLFASCDPGNEVLYLVLSILFGITLPFFMFACRGKDRGMPPRRTVQTPPELLTASREEPDISE